MRLLNFFKKSELLFRTHTPEFYKAGEVWRDDYTKQTYKITKVKKEAICVFMVYGKKI